MRFQLNGRRVDVRAHLLTRLLDVLRVELGLTGTKEGCGEGECGACTVLLDGAPVNACLVPLAQVRGSRVTTVEGLRARPWPRRLMAAFVANGGTQCGICSPGMIVTLAAQSSWVTPAETRAALAGNLCRCTGYQGIYRAVRAAVRDEARRPPATPADRARRRRSEPASRGAADAASRSPRRGTRR